MMILVSYFENNDTAKNQIKTKLARVFLKNPKKMDYFKNSTVMQTLNETLLKVDLDTDRFIQSLELIAHAIHLHRYKVKVKNPYKFISAPIFEDEKEDLEAIEVNDARKSIMNLTNEAFEAIPKAGKTKYFLVPVVPRVRR